MIPDKAHFFCGILKRITDGKFEGTPDSSLREFLTIGDPLDLLLATICFEATTRIQLETSLWEKGEATVLDMKIDDFINSHHGGFEDDDPYFITDSFMNFRKAIFDSIEHTKGESDRD